MGNKDNGFPQELLKDSYLLLIGYCIHTKTFGISLSEFPQILIKACISLLTNYVNNNTAIDCTVRSVCTSQSDPLANLSSAQEAGTFLIKQIYQKTRNYGTPHNILSTFVDIAKSEKLIDDKEEFEYIRLLNDSHSPSVEDLISKIGVTDLPECLYSHGNILLPTVLLLMYTQLSKVKPDSYTNDEHILHDLFEKVSY